ncbi:hypothetical protein [Alkalihalobacillus sp. LMS39]|uniref:hypothetical protein n=1 Tax=Alkalihalobacillus sp. LMS39 TaxID=2924032 RepID=UPI001FB21192|nr:hypothetical protein [Alkalihalobacillus sp. LMS39]UOE93046.1 hypothetical protein MM271_17780 [Alkalihalobacillus sp. LMS39]
MKRTRYFLFFIFVLLSMTGCSESNEQFTILVFADIPSEKQEEVNKYIQHVLEVEESQYDFTVFPVTFERLIAEIATHNGDLLLIDEELMSAAYDPDGLYELSDINEVSVIEPNPYFVINEETGKREIYAMPIQPDSLWFQKVGIEIEQPLVALVPVYSNKEAMAKQLLQSIIAIKQ